MYTITGQADGLRIDVSHSGVYDDRGGLNHTDNFACDRPRLPIGIVLTHFTGGVLTSLKVRDKTHSEKDNSHGYIHRHRNIST